MSNFRGRGGHTTAPQRGQFENGAWSCDCSPRLPAVHYQVKKDGLNKGRWFYSCQKPMSDENRCKFFLWDSDAKPREERALLNNSRSEPLRANANTPSKPQNIAEPPPPYTPNIPTEQSRKRSRAIIEEDDDFAFGQGEDAAFTNELNQVMAAAETPRKTARTDAFTTPAARRTLPWVKDSNDPTHGLRTPQTGYHAHTDLFQTRFSAPGGSLLTPSKPKDQEDDSHQATTASSSPFNTPTPSRFKDVSAVGAKEDLVQDVLGLLHEADIHLSGQTSVDLRNILSKHARKSEGYRRGQEQVRLTVKTKEAKIAELEYRIAILESGLEAEHAQ
ncbi:hypothetical protein K505DRAFT_247135 [Melanomma pulvis-pyrius CBS 109.77]|uniref:GRF-type domain-containing protein n=1 Tax=Melanomma pulvis-pyrius CBS 109.77 TaxID=1314802 RepID=A0A6A6X8N1_9PLEO|nr:hypothetical protein K505DRAFT_247135 [Melanomma pulvis-pyrius CBS 109.77]